ncbi:MAG: nucleotidyltransferase domain-containing protein [Candidatus Aenigmatarchaeota archaeon]
MLKIIDDLKPFFENCYARVNVRQYARLMKISPPTASSLLKGCEKDGLLVKEMDRNYIMFHTNRKSQEFIMMSRIYWQRRLGSLVKSIDADSIVLFGSLSKAETNLESDIDLAIFGGKKTNLEKFEKELKREIHAFWFDSLHDANKELRNNIINGHVLSGRLGL